MLDMKRMCKKEVEVNIPIKESKWFSSSPDKQKDFVSGLQKTYLRDNYSPHYHPFIHTDRLFTTSQRQPIIGLVMTEATMKVWEAKRKEGNFMPHTTLGVIPTPKGMSYGCETIMKQEQ